MPDCKGADGAAAVSRSNPAPLAANQLPQINRELAAAPQIGVRDEGDKYGAAAAPRRQQQRPEIRSRVRDLGPDKELVAAGSETGTVSLWSVAGN